MYLAQFMSLWIIFTYLIYIIANFSVQSSYYFSSLLLVYKTPTWMTATVSLLVHQKELQRYSIQAAILLYKYCGQSL